MKEHICPKCGKHLILIGKNVKGKVGTLWRCDDCQYNEPQWYETKPFPDDRPRDGMGMGHIVPIIDND